MSDNLSTAKQLLSAEGFTCVFCSSSDTSHSRLRGVKPLLERLESGKTLIGYAAADKVVGAAAAYIYALLSPDSLYAEVLSKPAEDILKKYGIAYSFGSLCDSIINRTGDGPCPMESAVKGAKDPKEALNLIKKKLKELNS